ncbi:MAG TPA: GNAT family N-acetyltransferase [Holophaga sp.]|nr:GNAT family N-acetyltransferase [Holophaga sp.]HPS66470.1 GNAT family N-acetyltransferase [Holophaga sp.]
MAASTLPRTVTLQDGRTIELLMLEVSDCLGLVEFYRTLPEQDREVLKDDVTTKEWADRFLRKVATKEIVCLVAKDGDKVVGEASLYRTLHGWTKHVGEIRLTIARSHRRQGLGLAMAGTLVKIATDIGIEKLLVNMVENQLGSRRTFEKLGFQKEAVLPRHVKDISGTKRDLIIMANDVSQIWAAMETMVQDYQPHRD